MNSGAYILVGILLWPIFTLITYYVLTEERALWIKILISILGFLFASMWPLSALIFIMAGLLYLVDMIKDQDATTTK